MRHDLEDRRKPDLQSLGRGWTEHEAEGTRRMKPVWVETVGVCLKTVWQEPSDAEEEE